MINKFSHRSFEAELIDAPAISKELLYKNLRELDFINRILRGHAASLLGIKKLITNKNKLYHLVDLGCGSGDTLRYIADWARVHGYKVTLTGIDQNPDAIDFLTNHCKNYPEITGVASDYRSFLHKEASIDIVHCSLFCHHLNDTDLLDLFVNLKLHAHTGFVVNDLHRHWITYYSVYLITHLLNGSTLSKHDGPISVLRSFKRKEIISLLQKARINRYFLHWKFPFRYLLTVHSDI